MNRILELTFLVVAIVHVGSFLVAPGYGPYTKPARLPLLLLYYLASAGSGNRSPMLVAALSLSFLGDVLLMQGDRELFFMLGLASFLGAHVCYILVYNTFCGEETERMLRGLQRLRYSFPVLLAGFGLLGILMPHAAGMRIPVAAYALILMAMVLAALYRFGRTSGRSFGLVFGGAILFMMSDSLLAVNKFIEPLPGASFWIMLTYCSAQYLIVRGLLLHPPARK
jgi:uncharacterized membrane protein YhhN